MYDEVGGGSDGRVACGRAHLALVLGIVLEAGRLNLNIYMYIYNASKKSRHPGYWLTVAKSKKNAMKTSQIAEKKKCQ